MGNHETFSSGVRLVSVLSAGASVPSAGEGEFGAELRSAGEGEFARPDLVLRGGGAGHLGCPAEAEARVRQR